MTRCSQAPFARPSTTRATDRFTEDDYEFLKFHGIYQQDDRDKRKTGKQYIFMVRGRLPGGSLNSDVYLAFDRLCGEFANNTLRITTRQGFQFHGVTKGSLGPFMKGLNDAMATTLAACGDVNRNVMAAPTPATSPLVDEIQRHAKIVSDALLPKTRAYHQIWVEGVELKLTDEDASFVDPLYGKSYLPRKFKVAFAIPPLNDIDIFTNDCGFVAIVEDGKLAGYNLLAGGGMGMSHGNAHTFPRLADVIGFVTPDQVISTAKGVVTIHRDFGDPHKPQTRPPQVRDRLARRSLVPRLIGKTPRLQTATGSPLRIHKPGRSLRLAKAVRRQILSRNFRGKWPDQGRRELPPQIRLARRCGTVQIGFASVALAKHFAGQRQAGGPRRDHQDSRRIRRASGKSGQRHSPCVHSMPALPTCGLALAESERVMPDVLTRLENLLTEVGLDGEEIIIRMTGCPNGCARPFTAELALVGKAPGKYQLYLGGNQPGTRLCSLYKESVKSDELVNELRPVFSRFARERLGAERFGDFSHRVLLPEKLASAPAEEAAA